MASQGVRITFVALLFMACSSSSSEPPAAGNGVNDVRAACQLRSNWTKRTSVSCTDCNSLSTAPPCDCLGKDYGGRCHGQQQTRTNEASCDGVDACISKCASTDCACIEGCYAGRDKCRTAASALDGCTAEVCDAYCR